MKKVLLTGGSGFVGRNIRPELEKKYDLYCPTRQELNLLDEQEVYRYLEKNQFDVVLHSANPNPVKNHLDKQEHMLEESMRIFMNFYRASQSYGKMFYFGSGAEYDKRQDLVSVTEDKIMDHVPIDSYGLAKLYMNQLARFSSNIYNMRLFGCYGPFDHSSKFLTHVIRCCLRKEEITIRQDCCFDYLQVGDLAGILDVFFNKALCYHDYNICSGQRYRLSEIAGMIREQMGSDAEIVVEKEGLNKEYTASNKRMLKELPEGYHLTSIEEGIDIQIHHEKEYYGQEISHII